MLQEKPLCSLVLAADYRVSERGRLLAYIGGLRRHDSIAGLIRSQAMFGWFDEARVDDLPAISRAKC
jgi:hypothetical protein